MRAAAWIVAALLVATAGAQAAHAAAPYSLRADADRAGLRLGSAAQSSHLDDGPFAELLTGHVNTLTFENETKFGPVHPEPGRYDFAGADRLAAFAQANGMKMRGHVLLWHAQNPDWLSALSPTREEALAIMRDHIRTVVGHFRDRFPGLVVHWDVVNEAIDNDGTRRRNVWQRWIGDDYVDHAFSYAREAAGPGVELYYNDYFDAGMVEGAEAVGGQFDDGDPVPMAAPGAQGSLPCEAFVKCRAVMQLVTGMVDRGVPIDGVGFQAHLANPNPSDHRALTSWVGRLGLRWAITELDVPVPRDAGEEGARHQANAYRLVTQSCLDDPACDTVVSWGISDRYTWWKTLLGGALPNALHFDESLEPKPAATALHDVLAAAPAAPAPAAPPQCRRRRSVTIAVPLRRGDRLLRARVQVGAGPKRLVRGHRRRLRVGLEGVAGRRVRIRMSMRVARGSRRVLLYQSRRYSTCA